MTDKRRRQSDFIQSIHPAQDVAYTQQMRVRRLNCTSMFEPESSNLSDRTVRSCFFRKVGHCVEGAGTVFDR